MRTVPGIISLDECHAEKYGDKGLAIVAVNLDQARQDADDFLQRNPAQFEIAFDAAGETPEKYHVQGMPSAFLIGPEGESVSGHAGFHTTRTHDYENEIRKALNLAPLDAPQAR